MGLIRKSLMVGSVGLVSGSSKKQRVNLATLNAVRAGNGQSKVHGSGRMAMAIANAQDNAASIQANREASAEWRAVNEARKAEKRALKAAKQQGAIAGAPTLPPPGWYPDAQGTSRWWNGTAWTEHTEPTNLTDPTDPTKENDQ